LCVVYGNCQAEPLRALLEVSAEFSSRFDTEPIPAIPELRKKLLAGDESPLRRLREAVSRAALVITQPVRDDYHGLPLGTDQVLAHAPRHHRRLTFAALHHPGAFPYFGYVPVPDGAPARAPLVEYHDLRIMACAARGWSAECSEHWLATYEPPAEALRSIWDHSQDVLTVLEQGLDVRIAGRLRAPDVPGRMFHTEDHPTVLLIGELAAGVHRALGLRWAAPPDPVDLLDWISAPIDAHTIRALELKIEPQQEWRRRGVSYTPEQLVAPHLEFYSEHPDALESGVSFHEARLRELDLSV
jgi:hypothetical protein